MAAHPPSQADYLTVPQIRDIIDELGFGIDQRMKNGTTLLHVAASFNAHEGVQELLKRGANLHLTDDRGRTALHRACMCASKSVVEMLLEAGADANALDRHLNTPLQFVCRNSTISPPTRIVSLLLRYGARINCTNFIGCTPVEHAVLDKNLGMLQALMENGANFPVNFEYLFASKPYTQLDQQKSHFLDGRMFVANRCLCYLINHPKWDEVRERVIQYMSCDKKARDRIFQDLRYCKNPRDIRQEEQMNQQDRQPTRSRYVHPKFLKQGFDFPSADESDLESDPRVQWMRYACLNKRLPYNPHEEGSSMTSTIKRLLIPKVNFGATPKRRHPIPLHRALSCNSTWCSWAHKEGYIRAMVRINPKAVEEVDPLTGLYAFQIAALRSGDLDSGYNLLRMAPHLAGLNDGRVPLSYRYKKGLNWIVVAIRRHLVTMVGGEDRLNLLFIAGSILFFFKTYHFSEFAILLSIYAFIYIPAVKLVL